MTAVGVECQRRQELAAGGSWAMFTADERVSLQQRLLARAQADTCIVGAAFTGCPAVSP